jgi:glucosamine--fructose-6-phosphate aminotransferase (isomerizing)|tara:strand:+ start:355 stop:618 length:264 start_codon:yes stop_codon:yes gene_type:complete
MCGIVGATSERHVGEILLEGLRRLEYRGYDSAGMAVIDKSQQLRSTRRTGKVQALTDAIETESMDGTLGIAHTPTMSTLLSSWQFRH